MSHHGTAERSSPRTAADETFQEASLRLARSGVPKERPRERRRSAYTFDTWLRPARLGALALLAVSAGASAQEPTLLTVAAGQFDANRRRNPAAELGFQLGPTVGRWTLRPILGGMGTTDGAALAYVGTALELGLGRRLVLRPSFAPGYYHQGKGKDLGGPVEFRSGLGIAWRIRSRVRLGVEFYHLSNAGLGRRNPGEETLAVNLSFPLSHSRSDPSD